jgi:hypothetical protein
METGMLLESVFSNSNKNTFTTTKNDSGNNLMVSQQWRREDIYIFLDLRSPSMLALFVTGVGSTDLEIKLDMHC